MQCMLTQALNKFGVHAKNGMMQIREAYKYTSRGSNNEHTHDSDMHQASDMHKGT